MSGPPQAVSPPQPSHMSIRHTFLSAHVKLTSTKISLQLLQLSAIDDNIIPPSDLGDERT